MWTLPSQQTNKWKSKKAKTCRIVDFAVPADQRVKIKESEKIDEYLDLAREQKSCLTRGWHCNWRAWNFICSPSHLRTSTAQGLFKVGPHAGPRPTRVRQNSKIPSAPLAFPQWGRLRCQETKQQTIVKTTGVLGTVPKGLESRCWKSWKSEDKSRPYKLQQCWDWLEYWEESWRPEETYCHLDPSERPSADAGMKILQKAK